jgi:polar amino acid transport system substrate-binding protein
MFFTLPDSRWTYTDQAGLSRIRLGAVQDYDYTEMLDLYIGRQAHSGKVWFARGDYPLERLVTALQERQIDAFIENRDVVNAYLQQHPGQVSLRMAGSAGPATRLYAAFSPRKTDAEGLARLFDRKIDDLRLSGQLQAILDRYGVKDWRNRSQSNLPAGGRQ